MSIAGTSMVFKGHPQCSALQIGNIQCPIIHLREFSARSCILEAQCARGTLAIDGCVRKQAWCMLVRH